MKKDVTCKPNCMLYSSLAATLLLRQSFSPPFMGQAPWSSSDSALKSCHGDNLQLVKYGLLYVYVTHVFHIKFLPHIRKIWSLLRTCHTGIPHKSLPHMHHTGIPHHVAQLENIYNIVLCRFSKLVLSALKSQSQLECDVFAAFSHHV